MRRHHVHSTLFPAACAFAVALSQPALGTPDQATADRALARSAGAILRADYRGDRAELRRLAAELASLPAPARWSNAAYREYWVGFAYWRRGINGFNESPRPDDLPADFELGAARHRAALAIDPAMDDARSALAGCLMGQLFTGSPAPERRSALLAEYRDALKELEKTADRNPRSLWILGGNLAFAPGGDQARAAAAYRRGLAAARVEAAVPRDPWVPSWGAPELLMSLAYLKAFGGSPDREAARAYADGALSMVPDWHYVKDILIPRIEQLPEPSPKPAPAP